MATDEQVAKGLRRPRAKTSSKTGADWGEVDATAIREVIAQAGLKHGALRFGYSRDGGAYAVGVYYADEYYTDYIRPDEDIVGYLGELAGSFREVDMYTATHPAPKSRKAK
jgi:hypothetical protein